MSKTIPPFWGEAELELRSLWLLAQDGDESAYREALVRIANLIRSYLRRRVIGRPDDVEDLVQESMLAVHLQRGSYDPRLPISAWIFAIARHKLIDFWRRNKRYDALHEPLDFFDDLELVGDEGGGGAARMDLIKLLVLLPHAQRQAIVMTKLLGLSAAEASVRIGYSEGAVRVLVHRGLKRLSQLVKRRVK